jgi:hypothetical protein
MSGDNKIPSQKRARSFEVVIKQRMNRHYQKLSRDDKATIREMSRCQMLGGAIGTRVLKEGH